MRVDVTVLQVSCCFGPLLAELPCLSPLPSDIQKTWPQVSEELLCLPRFGKQQVRGRMMQEICNHVKMVSTPNHRTCTGICWHSTWLCYPLIILNPSYTIGQAGAEGLRTAAVNTGASRMKCRRSLPSASWTPVISSQQHSSIADLSGVSFYLGTGEPCSLSISLKSNPSACPLCVPSNAASTRLKQIHLNALMLFIEDFTRCWTSSQINTLASLHSNSFQLPGLLQESLAAPARFNSWL